MLSTLKNKRGFGVEEAAPGLRNGAAKPAGQPGVWGISIPTPLCCHRCFPSTLQLQEMLVEQIFLLLQPLGAAGAGNGSRAAGSEPVPLLIFLMQLLKTQGMSNEPTRTQDKPPNPLLSTIVSPTPAPLSNRSFSVFLAATWTRRSCVVSQGIFLPWLCVLGPGSA